MRRAARRSSRRWSSVGSGQPGADGLVVLPEQGWRQVRLTATGVWAITEAQRRAGELDAAEDRMVDRDHQPLRPGLLPSVDLVEGAYLSRRHADRVQPGQP